MKRRIAFLKITNHKEASGQMPDLFTKQGDIIINDFYPFKGTEIENVVLL